MRYEIIPFGEHQISAVEADAKVFVLKKPLCDSLTIHWHAQRERIYRTPVLAEGARIIRVPSAHGEQEMVALDLEKLPGWLATIGTGHITDDTKRGMIEEYQRRAYRVLYEHFFGPMVSKGALHSEATKNAVKNRLPAALKQYSAEPNAEVRRVLLELMTDDCRILNIEPPNPELMPPPAPDYVAITRPVWDALAMLEASGHKCNLHRRAGELFAFNPAMVGDLCKAEDIPWTWTRRMQKALRLHPRYFADGTLNTNIGKHMQCWVFRVE